MLKNRNKTLPRAIEANKTTKRNWANETAIVVFCFGLGLLIWSSILFDRTMIHPLAVWITILFPGLPMVFMFRRPINNIAKKKIHFMLHYTFHACTTGSVIAFAILATNFYLSSANTSRKSVEILEFGSRNGGKGSSKRTPYALIKYKDLEKAYFLTEFEVKYTKNRDEMTIETKSGFFGFDVIEK